MADLVFHSRFVDTLPADADTRNHIRAVLNAAYSFVEPTAVSAPKIMAFARDLATDLGFPDNAETDPDTAAVLSGNKLLTGMRPYSAAYGGHQFGHWAGQLGDGRAITLGALVDKAGQAQELQLKGAGPTPYSRSADGRAVLRSSLREFACSEAMHHLGIPTTRALSLVATGDQVMRDMLYDGHPAFEPGAVVCRVAPSFLRFGNFELFAARRDFDLLQKTADYTIGELYPELGLPSPEAYARLFEEVCRRTAIMVDHWMRVGFVHGVMNTDNMSILGLTIDYGPYGWIDNYDPDWTPNTTDAQGRRYRFGHQPHVALWNLVRLAEALLPLVQDEQLLENGLKCYRETFASAQEATMAAKLGLTAWLPGDEDLVSDLFEALAERETDMTLFFRRLADVRGPTKAPDGASARFPSAAETISSAFYSQDQSTATEDHPPGNHAHVDTGSQAGEKMTAWLDRYQARLAINGPESGPESPEAAQKRRERMNASNPAFVLRNYLAQQAIDAAAAGDLEPLQRLMAALRTPYEESPANADFMKKRPDWARHKPGCSMLSCSS